MFSIQSCSKRYPSGEKSRDGNARMLQHIGVVSDHTQLQHFMTGLLIHICKHWLKHMDIGTITTSRRKSRGGNIQTIETHWFHFQLPGHYLWQEHPTLRRQSSPASAAAAGLLRACAFLRRLNSAISDLLRWPAASFSLVNLASTCPTPPLSVGAVLFSSVAVILLL